MKMGDDQALSVGRAVQALRPSWPAKSVATILQGDDLAHHDPRNLALAMLAVALDGDSDTPARVRGGGPWWKAVESWRGLELAAPTPTPTPYHRRPCPDHPNQRAVSCPDCKGQPLTPEAKARLIAKWRTDNPNQDLPGFMARWEKEMTS